jgi:hypothetical protein
MLDLASQPVIDKHGLVGGCVRLPIAVDADRLKAEVDALPADLWGTRGGRVGVHSAAEALFLRGYAPAEGDKPIEDRPALDHLPYIRSILGQIVPARPLRALLARLPAGANIPVHVDHGDYFTKSFRVHVAVETNDKVWMLANGRAYQMKPGEVWSINNLGEHGVVNAHPSLSRTHLIADFLPSEQLADLVRQADRTLGEAVR